MHPLPRRKCQRLPDNAEQREILAIHLRKRNRDAKQYRLQRCERKSRPAMSLRKISQSNRSDRVAATQAVLMRLYRTLKLRGLNPTRTIADALTTCPTFGQLPPPPATIGNG